MQSISTKALVFRCLLLAVVSPGACTTVDELDNPAEQTDEPVAHAPAGSLTDPSATGTPFQLVCDDAATCCPPGLTAVLGTAGVDIVTNATAGRCHVSLGGNDEITDTSASGRHAILAGPGDDSILGGHGPGILIGGDGNDTIYGRASDDVIRGGPMNDALYGSSGNDTIEGEGGNDSISGGDGNDVIVGGGGVDSINGNDHDDIIVVRDPCELAAGEEYHGGSGNDVLILPVSEATATGLGITITGFEKVIVIAEDQYLDCGAGCNCPSFPILDPGVCEFSGAADPADEANLEALCLEALATVTPAIVWTLPNAPVEADIDDFMDDYHTLHPTVVPGVSDLGYISAAPMDPTPIMGPPGTLQPGVDTTTTPCDLPAFPVLDVGIGVGGSHDNCSSAEEEIIAGDLAMARFQVWRARQSIDAIVAAAGTPAVAEAMWNQGSDELAASYWFGAYDPARVLIVKETLDDVWSSLHGDWAGGTRMNVQCWHPFTWWETTLIALFAPDRLIAKYFINPCWHDSKNWDGHSAHTLFTWDPVATALKFLYPAWSFEVCESYFDEPLERRRGAVLVHELLHHTVNAEGLIKDHHDSTGVCGDGNDPCYDPADAHELAVSFPDHAITNNSSYEAYVRWVGFAYTNGFCDDTHDALCFPSECCGNGVRDTDAGEICDGEDFGRHSCLDYGMAEGNLICSNDCQSVSTTRCDTQCGNGILEWASPFEECDGLDFGGQSCETFGFESGSLTCGSTCDLSTALCVGGTTTSPPASYAGCEVVAEDCDDDPALCAVLVGSAGDCLGGPCRRTDPSHRVDGQTNPFSDFHPKGDFEDQLGNLHLCNEINGQETTCVEENGWGVCKACGTGPGETMLGCSCNDDEDCGIDGLGCWGADFPHGGFCWPYEGPPSFQCEQGGCGQSIRDEDFASPAAEDGMGYCEHYSLTGEASCQPQRCGDIQAINCASWGLVCELDLGDDTCTVECFMAAACLVRGGRGGLPGGRGDR